MPSSERRPWASSSPWEGATRSPSCRPEMTIGRRPSATSGSTFENISGKHCQLRLISGVWHVRDLGSTNGTTVNGLQLTSDHTILPDDELGIAGHLFTIDYEPRGPATSWTTTRSWTRSWSRRTSAIRSWSWPGSTPTERARRPGPTPPSGSSGSRPRRPTSKTRSPSTSRTAPAPVVEANDDDFFKMIEDDVKKDKASIRAGPPRRDHRAGGPAFGRPPGP